MNSHLTQTAEATGSVAQNIARLNLLAPESTCSTDLAASPWDTPAGYGPGASQEDQIPSGYPVQGSIPEEYLKASDEELDARIVAAKATLWDKAVILGHFYQRDEVVKYADFVGDSFQLANAALTRDKAEAIVFCGVHFMAETADILSREDQAVILPNLAAGCSMADMADGPSVQQCWEELTALYKDEEDDGRMPVIPVTYMNCSAELKAFVGRNGDWYALPRMPPPYWSGPLNVDAESCSSPTSTWDATPPRPWALSWSRCPCGPRARLWAAMMKPPCTMPKSFCGTASARCTSASTLPRSPRPVRNSRAYASLCTQSAPWK